MNNDAIATVFIVVLMVLNAWQWQKYNAALRKIESLQTIITLYRTKSGPVWGDMNVVLTDALPEELKP